MHIPKLNKSCKHHETFHKVILYWDVCNANVLGSHALIKVLINVHLYKIFKESLELLKNL